MNTRIAIVVVASFIFAPFSAADAITDVRAALSKFSGAEPVKLRVKQSVTTSSDEEGSKPEDGTALLFIQANSDGVSMMYPSVELARADQEERANQQNPESPTGTRGALSELNPLQAAEFANFGPKLLRLIEKATVLSDKPQTFQGKPVRMVTLLIDPNLSQSAKKHVRSIQHHVTLRLGQDNVPLACESSLTVKARVLLIKVEHNTKESWTLTAHGSRLVVTRHAEESGGSAMGRGYRKKGSAVITVQ